MKTIYFTIILLFFFTEIRSQTINKVKSNNLSEIPLTPINAINFYYIPDSSLKTNKISLPASLGLSYLPQIIKKTGHPIFNSFLGTAKLNYDTLFKTISIYDYGKKKEVSYVVEIYDYSEKIILTETIEKESNFTINTLSNGMYLYKIFNNTNLVGYGKIQILK